MRNKLLRWIVTMNKKLTDLKNIGEKIAGRLNEAGIFCEEWHWYQSTINSNIRNNCALEPIISL